MSLKLFHAINCMYCIYEIDWTLNLHRILFGVLSRFALHSLYNCTTCSSWLKVGQVIEITQSFHRNRPSTIGGTAAGWKKWINSLRYPVSWNPGWPELGFVFLKRVIKFNPAQGNSVIETWVSSWWVCCNLIWLIKSKRKNEE